MSKAWAKREQSVSKAWAKREQSMSSPFLMTTFHLQFSAWFTTSKQNKQKQAWHFVVECPGQRTKTANQHGASIELGKNYVSCLSGVAMWYVETKHLALLALLCKILAVESSAQFYQRYKPSAAKVSSKLKNPRPGNPGILASLNNTSAEPKSGLIC